MLIVLTWLTAIVARRDDLSGDLRAPVIAKANLAGSPIVTYTVASARMDDEAMSWFVDNTVTKSPLSVRGVGAAACVGGVSREVRIELDPARMLALNATAADISRQLREIQQDASGGRADVGGIEQSIRTFATVRPAEELARMDIAVSDGRRKRARPIVMTTVAMGAGMLPIAIGVGTDPSFRAPMAIVVIGGLITSTFLSLLVIPAAFIYVDDAICCLRRPLRRGVHEPPAARGAGVVVAPPAGDPGHS